jgi:CheY-like chemotaxis protein
MRKKLLLADDSVTVQRVVELTFAEEGIDVIVAGDGGKALERAEQEHPDIVLADVSMPVRDGYAVAERLRSTPHLAHIPIVLMTGAFEQIDDARAKAVRCDAVLAKPFEPHMVIALVRQLLRGETPTDDPSRPDTSAPSALAGTSSPGPAAASLDAYLEQLDEALTAAAAVPPSPGARGTPARSTAPPTAATKESAADEPSELRGSLTGAFADMLAEELGDSPPRSWQTLGAPGSSELQRPPRPPADAVSRGAASSPERGGASPSLSDAVIEEISRRVAERLTDAAVRQIVERRVVEIAERLVKDEIARIRALEP